MLDFIEERQVIIQIIGSVIIFFFGLWIYRSHPSAQPTLPDKKPAGHSLFADFITSMALTLSNPLILFVLIALFARFDFVTSEMTIFVHGFALFSIFIGALLWWITLTSLVSKFRNRLNIIGLKIINRITGGVIMAIGLFSAFFALIS